MGAKERGDVPRVRTGLTCGQEPCADVGPRSSTLFERDGDILGGCDPACRDDRDVDRIGQPTDDPSPWRRAPHVTPSLDALGDHEVTAGADGGVPLVDRPHLPRSEGVTPVDLLDQTGLRIAVEELDDANPTGGELHIVEGREEWHQEVDADRAGLTERVEALDERVGMRAKHAQAARTGDGDGELGRGDPGRSPPAGSGSGIRPGT